MEYAILAGIAVIAALLVVVLVALNKNKDSGELKEDLRKENEALKNLLLQQNSELRKEINATLASYNSAVNTTVNQQITQLQNQMKEFSASMRENAEAERRQLDEMRRSMENNLRSIQTDNAEKLEKMRETVDEKLSSTLEKRLTESFETVGKQLESVYKGLGEMQTLASSVGDLKSALTNVKVRGTWGEVALDNLLSQVLSPEQYKRNVKPNPRKNNIVEFCICLPNNENNDIVYLPIDCKFPIEEYQRLCDASEAGDTAAIESASKSLEATIKLCAKTIRDKYIDPPHTTDFAIMYLPSEGLYAEVARKSGLCEVLQREMRVTVAGPTTIGAFLNSLQLGFKTLAIQKRTSEITKLLASFKKNFGKFAELLEQTRKKLDSASSNIEEATKRCYRIDTLLGKADSLAPADEEIVFLPEED
ncbi:MAG: DNA recombination protein RmuC [Clostridia bacterium]|nr:DNA recombination protein RmuC [Clostridia bacterium]